MKILVFGATGSQQFNVIGEAKKKGAEVIAVTSSAKSFEKLQLAGATPVFINHDCTFLDIGGITIEDDVLIGPKVSLITESHPLNPTERKALLVKPIVIKRNAWIGAGAIILPGVTVGENAVVAAIAVVNKDVADNTVVAGVPAKVIKTIS